ncbi:hypothetical protein Emed_005293 [Eimeria media]
MGEGGSSKIKQGPSQDLRWLSFVAEFPGLTITYKPGKDNVVADALSRNPLHQPATPPCSPSLRPPISARAILATLAARATRSRRRVKLSRRVADPIADPLLYELDDVVCEPSADKLQVVDEPTVANSGPTARPTTPVLQQGSADEPDPARQHDAISGSLDAREEEIETGDALRGVDTNDGEQQRKAIQVHSVSQGQGQSQNISTAVTLSDEEEQLPDDAHLFLPVALNGFWRETQTREYWDAADLERAIHGPVVRAGTEAWFKPLRQCPVYGEVLRFAEEAGEEVIFAAAKSPNVQQKYPTRGYRFRHNMLYVCLNGCWRIVVPSSLSIRMDFLYGFHDHPTAGHTGFNKTYQQITHIYYWKGIKELVKRSFVQLDHSHWENILPALELAYNLTPSSSTGLSAFQLMIGENPTTAESCDPFLYNQTPEMTKRFRMWVARAARHIARAQQQQQQQANKHRRDVVFREGDKVLLSTAHLPAQGCPKLQERFVGPFKVLKVLSDVAYKLDLPPSYTIHPVFHVSRLRPFCEDANLPREQRWSPIQRDGHLEYGVAAILDVRGPRKQPQYLIHWKGKSADEATWEPAANLTRCKHLSRSFHKTRNRQSAHQDHQQSIRQGRRRRGRQRPP